MIMKLFALPNRNHRWTPSRELINKT